VEAPAATPVSPRPSRHFPSANACGGLVAAVGVLFVAGVGLLTTLPGSPVAAGYAPWLAWALRLAPLPALLLLWAVVREADFRVKTDGAAIHFRRGLSGVARVSWREVQDFFADCGRSLREVAESGGSMAEGRPEAGVASQEDGDDVAAEAAPTAVKAAPFAAYRPDYVLLTERGAFIFDDVVARPGLLAEEVVRHALPPAPARWEEASWLACEGCGERLAFSLWRGPSLWDEPPPTCPRCAAPLEGLLAEVPRGFVVELRGIERRRFAWAAPAEPPAEVPGGIHEEPQAPAVAEEAPDEAG